MHSKIQPDCCGLLYVRYSPDSDQILHRGETTRCASGGQATQKKKPPGGGFLIQT